VKKILVTGAGGFIGKNLVFELENRNFEVFKFGKNGSEDQLREFLRRSDFVFHLAGVNRPKETKEFETGNRGFTERLVQLIKEQKRALPVVYTSSIQAKLDNPYGISKREAEKILFQYGRDTGAPVYIYRLPNVFGKWSRPNYNSAIATFCYNIARNLPITVNDPDVVMNLVYIDDVIREFVKAIDGKANVRDVFCEVPVVHQKRLGEIVDLIYSFKRSREEKSIPDMSDPFTKKLYSTYLSFLPEDQFSYKLKMNIDRRGSFTEFIKTADRGQVSVNISKPGITKGNHWHHTKNEKFLVVYGKGVIRFRKPDSDHVIEYYVSGDNLEVIDIPPGYTHNIENLGDTDMVTIMWANEMFDPENPDTYFLEV